MTKQEAWASASSEHPKRIETLKSQTYVELLALPPHETAAVLYGEHEVKWTVYRDILEDRRLKIVVQLSMRTGMVMRVFPLSNVEAKGFWIGPDGAIASLPEKELYEFM